MIGHLQPGMGLGLTGSKEIALGLGTPYDYIPPVPEPDEGGGGGGISAREYSELSKHRGKWKKRLEKEDQDLLAFICSITPRL